MLVSFIKERQRALVKSYRGVQWRHTDFLVFIFSYTPGQEGVSTLQLTRLLSHVAIHSERHSKELKNHEETASVIF